MQDRDEERKSNGNQDRYKIQLHDSGKRYFCMVNLGRNFREDAQAQGDRAMDIPDVLT
jgi:hypothetical protein